MYLLGGSGLLGGGLLDRLLLGDLGLLLDLGLGGQAVRASVALGVDELLLLGAALKGEAEVRLAGVADLVLGVDELEDGLARRAATLVQGLNGLLDHSRVPGGRGGCCQEICVLLAEIRLLNKDRSAAGATCGTYLGWAGAAFLDAAALGAMMSVFQKFFK